MERHAAFVGLGILLFAVCGGVIIGVVGPPVAPPVVESSPSQGTSFPVDGSVSGGIESHASSAPRPILDAAASDPVGADAASLPGFAHGAVQAAEQLLRQDVTARALARTSPRPSPCCTDLTVKRRSAARHAGRPDWVVVVLTWLATAPGAPEPVAQVTTRLVMAPDGRGWRPVPPWEEPR